MLQRTLIGKVILQVLAVAGYLALVCGLYLIGQDNLGAVVVILGMLFFFKAVVASGDISIAHLLPSDPRSNIRAPRIELLKATSFLAVGLGLVVDLREAGAVGMMPGTLGTAVIFLTLSFICAACVGCCLARLVIGFIYGTRA